LPAYKEPGVPRPTNKPAIYRANELEAFSLASSVATVLSQRETNDDKVQVGAHSIGGDGIKGCQFESSQIASVEGGSRRQSANDRFTCTVFVKAWFVIGLGVLQQPLWCAIFPKLRRGSTGW
jgi:hypothetical protein